MPSGCGTFSAAGAFSIVTGNHLGRRRAMRKQGWLGFGLLALCLVGAMSAMACEEPEPDQEEAATDVTPASTAEAATATPTINWAKPGPDVTPAPGQTPDPRQPWWWIPWENVERAKPYFEGELSGIRITTHPYEPPFERCPDIRYVLPEDDY